MKKGIVLFTCMFMFLLSSFAIAQDAVTPQDIIDKVTEAAAFLAENGEEGLTSFNQAEGPWVWGGTYVFVFDCESGIIAAHPNNDLIGVELGSREDVNGFKYNLALCEEALKQNGGWVEYWRPTDTLDSEGNQQYRRKISYIIGVDGQPYQVGAGIYEPDMTVDELNALTE